MHSKDNYLKNAELSTEQNCNMIDGIPNNTAVTAKKEDAIPASALLRKAAASRSVR